MTCNAGGYSYRVTAVTTNDAGQLQESVPSNTVPAAGQEPADGLLRRDELLVIHKRCTREQCPNNLDAHGRFLRNPSQWLGKCSLRQSRDQLIGKHA